MAALIMVALLVFTAIVVDVGNSRQQKRQAVSAADAGALAGAQSLLSATMTPSGCPDSNCVAAYFTLASAEIPTAASTLGAARSTCTIEAVQPGETCFEYRSGRATLDVTSPYRLGAADPDVSLVHVGICWASNTSFARVIGRDSITICGSATARNSGVGDGASGAPGPTADCAGEDNFADAADEPTIYAFNPGDYPDQGGAINFNKGGANPKHDTVLVALFDGRDSDLLLSSIAFTAPTTVSGPSGQSVALSRILPADIRGPKSPEARGIGYTVQSLDASGRLQAYAPGGTYRAVIAYQLPDDAHLKVAGKSFVYDVTLWAADVDQDPGPDCGNASWTVTHDGKRITSPTTACGESSFLALGVFPSNGTGRPGDRVGAYYGDESPIQDLDVTDPFWSTQPGNFGIDFELSGGAFTDVAGKGFQIPRDDGVNAGYTIGPLPPGVTSRERYSNTVSWALPVASDPRWVNGVKYTVFLKVYDTDNNKPGNDCGTATWSFVLTGATGGAIHLVE